jgi:hypothetical protein
MSPEALARAREYDRIRDRRRKETGADRLRRAKYATPAHRALRARLDPVVQSGTVHCARCGWLIEPGTPWDLGHVDENPSLYAGPEHRSCNRATAAHAKQRRQAARRHVSRRW